MVTVKECLHAKPITECLPSKPGVGKWIGKTVASWPTWLSIPTFATLRYLNADIEPTFDNTVREHLPILDVLQNVALDYTRLTSKEAEAIMRGELYNLTDSNSDDLRKKLNAIKLADIQELDLHGVCLYSHDKDDHPYLPLTNPWHSWDRLKVICDLMPSLKRLNFASVKIISHFPGAWGDYLRIIAERLPQLEVLDLSEIRLHEASIDPITQMKNLKRLYVRPFVDRFGEQYGATDAAKARLKAALPNLEIIEN